MPEEEEPGIPPPFGQRSLIDQPEQLAAVVDRLLCEPALGVDVEAGIPPRERHSKFALLQIAVPGETFAVDPLRLRDLSALAPVFASPSIIKVFHGISLDREMLEGAGLILRQVVDLSDLARSAYGKGEASLAALARRAFGIGMDKSLQRSDWLHRPLTLPMLAYAWRDAELTLALYSWAATHQPRLLALHGRLYPRAVVPEGLPHWLTTILEGSRQSAFDLLSQDQLDIDRDSPAVVVAVQQALALTQEPGMRVRILRAAGELELFELVGDLIASLAAPSAPERAAAVRALAQMGELSAELAIHQLLEDPTEEVREAAEQALQILPERAAATSPASGSEEHPDGISPAVP